MGDKALSVVSGMIGGLITVAIVSLVLNPRNKTADVIKSAFGGFTESLRAAMGTDSRY